MVDAPSDGVPSFKFTPGVFLSMPLGWGDDGLSLGALRGVLVFDHEGNSNGTLDFNASYTGKEFDTDTGLYYYNARFYDPTLGRFITEDPARSGGNWYEYGNDNPLRFVDPTGLEDVGVIDRNGGLSQSAQKGNDVGARLQQIAGGVRKGMAAALGFVAENNVSAWAEKAGLPPMALMPLTGETALVSTMLKADAAMLETAPKLMEDAAETLQTVKTVAGDGEKALPQVYIDSSKHPESAQHALDAQTNGKPDVLTVARPGADANRAESLKGLAKVPGKQLDEYPPAMFKEGGAGASVRPISPSDNMGAGASLGNQLRNVPDGTQVQIVVK